MALLKFNRTRATGEIQLQIKVSNIRILGFDTLDNIVSSVHFLTHSSARPFALPHRRPVHSRVKHRVLRQRPCAENRHANPMPGLDQRKQGEIVKVCDICAELLKALGKFVRKPPYVL